MAGTEIQIVVHGEKQLQATMIKAAADMGHMGGASRKVSAQLAQRGRAAAPKRSGTLARSIRPQPSNGNKATVVGTVVYAGVIHNGWPRHHISPNPFLKRTLYSSAGAIKGEYAKEVQRALDHVKGA